MLGCNDRKIENALAVSSNKYQVPTVPRYPKIKLSAVDMLDLGVNFSRSTHVEITEISNDLASVY